MPTACQGFASPLPNLRSQDVAVPPGTPRPNLLSWVGASPDPGNQGESLAQKITNYILNEQFQLSNAKTPPQATQKKESYSYIQKHGCAIKRNKILASCLVTNIWGDGCGPCCLKGERCRCFRKQAGRRCKLWRRLFSKLEPGPDRFTIPCYRTVPEAGGLILLTEVDADLAAASSGLRTAPGSRLDRSERADGSLGRRK